MTYAIGRPAHFAATGIRSTRNLIHIGSGWSAFEGTRTRCGKTLKNGDDYFHLVAPTRECIAETFVDGVPCERCLSAIARAQERSA